MPEGPRTKRILSALINFAKFREERLGTYQEFTAQTDQLIDLKVALEEENQTLTQNLQELT